MAKVTNKTILRKKKVKKTAVERASEMMYIKQIDLPKLAFEYFRFLASKYGGCGEVYVTAFAHYAQAVEGLKCDDDLYMISAEGTKWFNEHYHRESHPNNVVEVNL